MNEEELKLEKKIKDISPYFDRAVDLLKKFSESVKLSDDEEVLEKVFEKCDSTIYPSIVLLDSPYPIIQCSTKSFLQKSKIEVSYGVFAILGMLGEIGDAAENIIAYHIPYDAVWQSNREKLINCVKEALIYLKQAYNCSDKTVFKMPEMTLHSDIFYGALKFIIGHELSHYIDKYINKDIREYQQDEIMDICIRLLNSLKSTKYKKYADKFFNNISGAYNEIDTFFKNMTEEVLADYEGYLYLWDFTNDSYKNMLYTMGTSMAFIALRILEYFETIIKKDSQQTFPISVKWRETFLLCVLFKKHNNQYTSLGKYVHNEWYPYQVVDALFEQIITEIESEGKDIGNEGHINEQESDYSTELIYCEELIKRLKKVSIYEVEEVFNEIDTIFDKYSLDEQFRKVFPAQKLSEVLCEIGLFFYDKKIYGEASKWWFRAVSYFKLSDNSNRLLEADCYFYLGKICYKEGYYEDASQWYNEALAIRQCYPGISDEDNNTLKLDIAMSYIDSNKYDLAISTLNDILSCTEDKYTFKEVYRKMGIISDKLGNYKNAIEWFTLGMNIAEADFGKEDLETATFYSSMGIEYYCIEDYVNSEKYLMRAYNIKKNKLDEDNISLTNTMYSLGVLESRRGCYDKSLEWFEKVLKIRVKVLGENHPLVGDTFQSMAIAYYSKYDYDNALMYNKRAFNILKGTLGRKHELTINAENGIDLCLEKMEEAE